MAEECANFLKLLECLILCSEKSAYIARLIKRQECLFKTLIQQKDASESNTRFSVDLKTLADVLIQEVIKYDIEQSFPGFGISVFGEENNQFSNSLGKTITVQLSSKEYLVELLVEILSGDIKLAEQLSDACFKSLEYFKTEPAVSNIWKELTTVFHSTIDIDPKWNDYFSYGIWIDPIDSTADYAHGQLKEFSAVFEPESQPDYIENSHQIDQFFGDSTSFTRYYPGNLINVTILLGLFHRSSGLPLIGVLNQPFYPLHLSVYDMNVPNKRDYDDFGRIFWGLSVFSSKNVLSTRYSQNCVISSSLSSSSHLIDNCPFPRCFRFPDKFYDTLCPDQIFSQNKPVLKIACSSMEFSRLVNIFSNYRDENGDLTNVVFLSSPGAGFKQLCVILDEVDAFILMEPTTFIWDTCGPHAILCSLGGGVINLTNSLEMTGNLIKQNNNNYLNKVEQILMEKLYDLQIIYNQIIDDSQQNKVTNSSKLTCNQEGLLAYRNPVVACQILMHLASVQKDTLYPKFSRN